jgi:hypothetical protein
MNDKIRSVAPLLSASTVLKTWGACSLMGACLAWFPKLLTVWFLTGFFLGHIILALAVIRRGRLRLAPPFNSASLDLVCIAGLPWLGSLVWLYAWKKAKRSGQEKKRGPSGPRGTEIPTSGTGN